MPFANGFLGSPGSWLLAMCCLWLCPSLAQPLTLTPAQGEGPFYTPVAWRSADTDSDRYVLAGAAGLPRGPELLLSGQVLNRNGEALPGAVVELWQADFNGVYLHPGDANANARDTNFQFYGESPTDARGVYAFRTIRPARCSSHPSHLHFKVKRAGATLLTSQFYFEDERQVVLGEGMAGSLGDALELILLKARTVKDLDGLQRLVAHQDIVVDGPVGVSAAFVPTLRNPRRDAQRIVFDLDAGRKADVEFSPDLKVWQTVGAGISRRFEDSAIERLRAPAGFYRATSR